MQKASPEIRRINWLLPITLAAVIIYELIDPFKRADFGIKLFLSNLVFAIPMLVYLCFVEKSFKEKARFKKLSFPNIILCVILFFCIRPVLSFFNAFSMLYSDNVVVTELFNISDETPFLVGLFAIAVSPAVLEELTYRGGYYNTYRKVRPLGAVLLSGLIFGIIHLNLNQFTYAFVLGCIFALIVEATDTTLSTMIIHFLINCQTILALYGLPYMFEYLGGLYGEALAAGDTMTLDMLERIKSMLDITEFSREAFIDAFGSAEYTTSMVLASLGGAFVDALIGGALAFAVFRWLAIRCGRWDHIKSIFTPKQSEPEVKQHVVFADVFSDAPANADPEGGAAGQYPNGMPFAETFYSKRLITVPAWIMIGFCTFVMVVNALV